MNILSIEDMWNLLKSDIEKFNERFHVGDIVRHYESIGGTDHTYKIIALAYDVTNKCDCVVYKPLYDCDYDTFTRSIREFISEVDKIKNPKSKQKYKYEVIIREKEE